MLVFMFCCFAICGFFIALLVNSTLLCLLLTICGIIALAVAFSYMGLLLLSSVSLLAYAGIFIVLFLISRKCLTDDTQKLKTILMFAIGLLVTIILCCLIPNDTMIHNVELEFDIYEQPVNLVIISLIILVSLLAAIFSKYDFSINIKKKKDVVKLLDKDDNE